MSLIVPAMKVSSFLGISPLGAYHSLMFGRSMYFDVSRAISELGWKPERSNNEMFVERANCDAVLVGTKAASHHRSAVRQGVLKALHRFF